MGILSDVWQTRLPIVTGLGLILLQPMSESSAQTNALPDEPNWQTICKADLAEPLPTTAAQLADTARRDQNLPRHCDDEATYYGFGRAPDYAEARRCAYLQRDKPENKARDFVHGPGTLAMLYANGYGVPRNYPLAIRFACEFSELGSANAETRMRIGRLEALRDGKLSQSKPFDLCDDATSGAMGAYCQEVTEKIAEVGRGRRFEALKVRLSVQAQAMLPKLEAAETSFEKARGEGEYSGGGGSGSAGFVEADQGQLREQFVTNLRRFAAKDLPKATSEVRAQAEQQVKAAADAAQDFKPDPDAGPRTPTPQSLAATEQVWNALFAAWMRFVPVAYPQLSLDAAATELLRLRLHQLKRVSPPD